MMQRMRSLPGVLYAEDFDTPSDLGINDHHGDKPAVPLAEPVVLEPTFSLVDLQSASHRAHEEGRSLEREELAAGLEARRADALTAIGDALRQARADCKRIATAEASSLSRTVLAAVAAVLPGLASAHGPHEIAVLLAVLLPALEGEPKLQIRVSPAVLDPLRNDLATIPMAESVAVEWIAVEAMEPGDISVKWQDGAMVRDARALCAQVVAMLSSALEQTDLPSERLS